MLHFQRCLLCLYLPLILLVFFLSFSTRFIFYYFFFFGILSFLQHFFLMTKKRVNTFFFFIQISENLKRQKCLQYTCDLLKLSQSYYVNNFVVFNAFYVLLN